MNRLCFRLGALSAAGAMIFALGGLAQNPPTPLTWRQVEARFEAVNPTLIAARANIDESRAAEITAFLKPNPDFSITADGLQVTPGIAGIWRPLSGVLFTESLGYTVERAGKRQLRLDNAKKSTEIAQSSYFDQRRTLLFTLRSAFVQMLQAKAFLNNADDNLRYWDQELQINQNRYNAGDLALNDYNRLKLQRAQFEQDQLTAILNVQTNKIAMRQLLLLDRTPLESFDIAGPYTYEESLKPLETFRNAAIQVRPDLKVAQQNVELARLAHKLAIANGSVDPSFGIWYSNNGSFANAFANNTIGGSIDIPIRIHDRNQGEKARTQIDIGAKEKLENAAESQVFSDVDTAYVNIQQSLALLGRYKTIYVPLSADVRDKTRDAYQHGGASLLDYLDAEKAYRDNNLFYLNTIGSYLVSAAQMNEAVGEEVIP